VHKCAAELQSYGVSVAIITETHYKAKHTDSVLSIKGFTLYRRDRVGRRGGGVAIYVETGLRSTRWTPTVAADRALEIEWVRIGDCVFVVAIYNPPRPVYHPEALLEHVEACVAEITHDYPLAEIVMAGDLNQMLDCDVVERTGLMQIVRQSTRGDNILDRVFVSNFDLYSMVRVVTSVVRSDHKAVVAYSYRSHPPPKTTVQRAYRRHTPAQHARFLQYAVSTDLTNPFPTVSTDPAANTQAEFDYFYTVARNLMDEYYPEQTITLTSRDPPYITPVIKSMLRRKNKLMRAGRVEEAGALSVRIGQAIQRRCKTQLSRYDGKTDAASMWAAVRRLTGRAWTPAKVDGVTAEVLNRHYADISTDPLYTKPALKPLADDTSDRPQCISE